MELCAVKTLCQQAWIKHPSIHLINHWSSSTSCGAAASSSSYWSRGSVHLSLTGRLELLKHWAVKSASNLGSFIRIYSATKGSDWAFLSPSVWTLERQLDRRPPWKHKIHFQPQYLFRGEVTLSMHKFLTKHKSRQLSVSLRCFCYPLSAFSPQLNKIHYVV